MHICLLGLLAMFSWEDEIISTMKTRLFQVKCNMCWHNHEIFKESEAITTFNRVGKTENYVSVNKLPWTTGLSLKKPCHTPKQCFFAMACNSKLHSVILWCVISKKLNIGKKITGLKIMTFNRKKIQHVSRRIELIFNGESCCL